MKVRKPNFFESIFPICFMLFALGLGYGYLGLRAEPLLILSAFIAGLIGLRIGLKWSNMLDGIIEKLTKSMPATLILISVGILIGTWMFSGTIPMLIYYGVQLISPNFILVTSFIVSAIISSVTGTSWGSVGTIGVALIGIASGLGVSLPATAGAIVAGAYFGDKMSPLSDTTNLAPIAAGSNLYEHIKHMIWTTAPGFILSVIIYFIVGFSSNATEISSPENIKSIISTLDKMFDWNILLLLPLVIVLYGSITKKPVIPIMLISSVISIILGITLQGFSLKNGFLSVVDGFRIDMLHNDNFIADNVIPDIVRLLNRGGMNSMMGTVLIAFCAFGFAGIVTKTGSLEVILSKIVSIIKTTFGLITSTCIASITMALVTGSSYLSILIPGELFSDTYKKMGLASKNLSRTLEDAGTVVVPLIPWSMAGVYMSATLGVPVLDYAPWAILCYTGFILAIIYSITGIGIAKEVEEKISEK